MPRPRAQLGVCKVNAAQVVGVTVGTLQQLGQYELEGVEAFSLGGHLGALPGYGHAARHVDHIEAANLGITGQRDGDGVQGAGMLALLLVQQGQQRRMRSHEARGVHGFLHGRQAAREAAGAATAAGFRGTSRGDRLKSPLRLT